MKKRLGIDLGTNSIGWAIRKVNTKLKNQIVNKGVLLFDKGVATNKGNEYPKVQKRTESRGVRRNYQAEKYRKYKLLEFLINKNMCPLSITDLDNWRKYVKGTKRKYPQSQNFINWLRFDFNGDGKPDFHLLDKNKHESNYVFRALSIDNKYKHVFDDNPFILGRVLYQLAQRRGFKGRDEEEAETMLKGSSATGTLGRNDIEEFINKYQTLGSALYHYQKEKGGRIRNRYNLRKDFEFELKMICDVHNFDNTTYQKLWKYIIWQRPLRTQKGKVGLCTFEKNKKRVAASHPWYLEYKTWTFINNLKIIAPEGFNQVEYLHDKIYPIFIRKSDFEVKHIIEQVKKDGGKIDSKYNSIRLQETKVVSLSNFYSFEQVFGSDWKEKLSFDAIYNRAPQPTKKETSNYTIEDIWHVLNTFDSKEKIEGFAKNKLNIDDKRAKIFSNIKLDNGYATIGLSAVKKILPYLKRGIKYSHAVYLANLSKVLGSNEINEELIKYFIEEVNFITYNVELTKKLNRVINNIIKNHLEKDGRYFINNNRELEGFEINSIKLKLQNYFGEYTWSNFSDTEKDLKIKYVSKHFKEFLQKNINDKKDVFLKSPRLHQEIFNVLKDKYNLPKENIKYLWHPSEQEVYQKAELYHKFIYKNKNIFIPNSKHSLFSAKFPDAIDEMISLNLLGSPEPISKGFKNPMALKTLHKLKQLLNHLLKTNQIDEYTEIVIEIARELNDNNMRAAIRTYQNKREKEKLKYKKQIEEINEECNTNFDSNDSQLLKKLYLWNEQDKTCFYTGKKINLFDALNGNKYDIEHTIPASMSFDSELKNLTLADTNYNRTIKKKQIPYQLQDYNEILKRVDFMKDKIDKFEKALKDNFRYTKTLQDKSKKDKSIQNRHIIKFELKYWREKYKTFTAKEYKLGWRNSQLRDTQIITKYALPFLKTVFKRVSVEKGITVNNFKEIYKVKLSDKKDRSKHSHHAIDAAILTLIPNSYERDKILGKFYEAKEFNKKYHTVPLNWESFKASTIILIENEVIGNNLVDDRKLTKTFKKVRKRGRIIYNDLLNKKPRIAKGDTIRGQLHKESFFGAIKQPLIVDGKIVFDENNRMKLKDEIKLVIRKPLKYKGTNDDDGFKNLSELEKVIVDKGLFSIIKRQIGAFSFKEALDKGIYMLNKQGDKVNQIKKVRCFANTKYETAITPHEHITKSNKKYKHHTYALNSENAYCFYYTGTINGKTQKAMKTISLFELSKLKLKSIDEIYEIPYYNIYSEKNQTLKLEKIFKTGDRVIFYKESKIELLDLSHKEILGRLYKAYQFEGDSNKIKFKHHLISGEMTQIKKTYKDVTNPKFLEYEPLLRLTKKKWNFAIEDVDFTISIDGKINWLS